MTFSDEFELDDEDRCEMQADLDCPCEMKATVIVSEPYTPAAFKKQVCEDHAEGLLKYFGYRREGEIA